MREWEWGSSGEGAEPGQAHSWCASRKLPDPGNAGGLALELLGIAARSCREAGSESLGTDAWLQGSSGLTWTLCQLPLPRESPAAGPLPWASWCLEEPWLRITQH